jgi:uncharacterized protein (TIGR02391 family)
MTNPKTLIKDYNDILESVKSGKKLSELFPAFLILVKILGNDELIKWTQLEMSSYFNSNSALTDDVTVPEYRIVVGQYYDHFERPLVITDPELNFVNEIRLRNGVSELEKFAEENKFLITQDPTYIKLIKDALNIEVHSFYFSSTSVVGVLEGIRNEFINKLMSMSKEVEDAGKAAGESTHTNLHLSLENLHPLVKSVAVKLFLDGYYRQAILDTYILLTDTVKTKSGRHDLDGSALMQTVFSARNPTIKISDDPDEQLGFMWMFSGAVMGIRNPKAHRLVQQTDPQRTLEWLSYASVLLRVLDDAEVIKT